jgi:(R,R)-butanediol dehydrogenase / meso-butanediol dehydrogenase / diacetyl reductase
MKAAVFRRVGQPLQVEEISDPMPLSGQVLLRVGRCGICGTDLHMTDGHNAMLSVSAGSILGHEFAGEIAELGPDVANLAVGDRIAVLPILGCGQCAGCLSGHPTWCSQARMNFGGYAQYAISGARECIRLPESLSLADGALVEPLAVAVHGVKRAGIGPDSRVLVLGAGPIGLAAVFWARRLGAARVEVVERSVVRGEIALGMGADRWSPPQNDETIDNSISIGGTIDPLAPDVVIECTGLPGLVKQAIDRVRHRGHILVLGFCAVQDTFIPALANLKNVRIDFSNAWSLSDFEVSALALDSGAVQLRAMITDTVSLAQAPAAFEALRHRTSQCKVLIDPWREAS